MLCDTSKRPVTAVSSCCQLMISALRCPRNSLMLLRYRQIHGRKKSNCLRMVSTCAASNVRVNHGYLWLHVPVISPQIKTMENSGSYLPSSATSLTTGRIWMQTVCEYIQDLQGKERLVAAAATLTNIRRMASWAPLVPTSRSPSPHQRPGLCSSTTSTAGTRRTSGL